MSSYFGSRVRTAIFGESHGAAVGVTVDAFPSGEAVDTDELRRFMARRAPGQGAHTTARREADTVRIISGLTGGYTNGAPLTAIIENTDTRSADYPDYADKPRPGHADFTASVKYGGYADPRGGGHFSGRLTAPLCAAGGIAKQILARRGIRVYAHVHSIAGVRDDTVDMASPDMEALARCAKKPISALSDSAAERMAGEISRAARERDSLGGIVECVADGIPAGLGSPMFGGVENRVAAAVFGIPAVRAVEFGAGFAAAEMRGSEHNDPFIMKNGAVKTVTNNHGGALGGITSSMPLVVRAAFKPTPSIASRQSTVSLGAGSAASIEVAGRHDPSVVPRAVPCVEAAIALVILDMMEEGL